MSNEWDIVIKVGSLSGMLSLIILGVSRVYRWFKRPKLSIEFDKSQNLRTYSFVDTPWRRKVFTLHIGNSGKYIAKRCIGMVNVITSPAGISHPKGKFPLHWGDIDYSARATEAQPVDIGSEGRQLDVVFSDRDNPKGGWLAVPLALSAPKKAQQFHLPPGEYRLEVTVLCENGKVDTKQFKITSPQDWIGLDVVEVS